MDGFGRLTSIGGALLLLRPAAFDVILALCRPASVLRGAGIGIAASLLLLGAPASLSLALWFGAEALVRRLRPRLEVFAAGKAFSLCHDELQAERNAWIHDTIR